ncbi:MAG: GNAT family N-acetyltransferase [Syntrophobacteraceae bacterium]|jgi:ribosomal protein S18 acetylase RimI-like enzyme
MAYSVRKMKKEEVVLALKWAEIEGWNPGVNDADCFYAADPNGFLPGELEGEPIGSISVVKYGQDFGFLGLYIVRPEFRGKGYGLRLWKAGIDYLAGRNAGLDGVVAQQENYKKSGFRLAYRNIRYEGKTVKAGYRNTSLKPAPAIDEIVDLSTFSFAEVAGYDRKFFPAPRNRFLECWVNQPGGHALGSLIQGGLAGYSVMRPCHNGFKIGPLFADTIDSAEALLAALCERASGEPVFLDVPEANPAAVALAESHGMRKVFETARMYTKSEPEISLARTFGVTTFELG